MLTVATIGVGPIIMGADFGMVNIYLVQVAQNKCGRVSQGRGRPNMLRTLTLYQSQEFVVQFTINMSNCIGNTLQHIDKRL